MRTFPGAATTLAPEEAIIATEIELKLAANARDLPLLARTLAARAGAAGLRRNKLVSTYYDTPDHALARRGLALRVREKRGRYIQTVKSDRSANAALARGEWEDVIATPEPDARAIETGKFLEPDVADRLTPLFRTEVNRSTIDLAPAPGTHIEAAIDRGRIVAPGRQASQALSEIELELKSGPAVALYDMAIELLSAAPLRLERRSKAERGYGLATDADGSVAAVHAASIELAPTLSSEEALQRIGLTCLDHILQNERAVIAGLPEGVHQMRVAVRRLRAVLSAFSDIVPAADRHWAAAELRWLASALSAARNLDVFENSLLVPAQRALAERGGIAALSAAAERRRKAAYAKARQAVRSTRYTALMLHLLRWFDSRGWRQNGAVDELRLSIGAMAADILDRRRRAARRRGKDFAHQSPPQRHKLRIALKKLRYAVEVLAALYEPGLVGPFTRRLKRLQDDLGDANDLRIGQDLVAKLAKPDGNAEAMVRAGKKMLDWHAHRLAKHEPKLRRHLERLLDAEPFWA